MKISANKKLIVVAFAVFIAVGGVLYLGFARENGVRKTSNLTDTSVLRAALVSELTQKDTDGDGLFDWEENLWKTDIDNPDTDGDGTSDGDEANTNRNPTVAGPNDTMELTSPTESLESRENLNATDVFAQQFFKEYVTRRQPDIGIDPLSQQAIISTSLASLPVSTANIRYSSSDLVISTKSGEVAVFEYGNRLGKIINDSGRPDSSNELELLIQLLEEKDRNLIEKFDMLTTSYQNVREQFVETPVPTGGVAIHLDLLNNMAAVEKSIRGMSRALDDPITALVSLNSYETYAGRQLDTLTRLRKFFLNNNVVYSPEDSGYIMQISNYE